MLYYCQFVRQVIVSRLNNERKKETNKHLYVGRINLSGEPEGLRDLRSGFEILNLFTFSLLTIFLFSFSLFTNLTFYNSSFSHFLSGKADDWGTSRQNTLAAATFSDTP